MPHNNLIFKEPRLVSHFEQNTKLDKSVCYKRFNVNINDIRIHRRFERNDKRCAKRLPHRYIVVHFISAQLKLQNEPEAYEPHRGVYVECVCVCVCGDSRFILGAMIPHAPQMCSPTPAPESNQSDSPGQVRL